MDAVVVNVSQVEYSTENFQNIQILVEVNHRFLKLLNLDLE